MFRTVPLSIIRNFSLYTQQYYMSYRFTDSLRAESGWNQFRPDPVRKLSATCVTYNIAACTVKSPDDGQGNCLKHVEFYSKNKFEKLVHLGGFIIRIYHDVRSSERHKTYLHNSVNGSWSVCYYKIQSLTSYFIHSLVFSLRGRVGRNQSPVM